MQECASELIFMGDVQLRLASIARHVFQPKFTAFIDFARSKRYKAAALSQEDATRNADSDCDHEEATRSIRKVQDTGERCHFGHKPTTT